MEKFVEYVAKALVDHPEDVEVRAVNDGEEKTLLELHVHKDDLGRVIGKNGRTAQALRTLLTAASPDKPIELDIPD